MATIENPNPVTAGTFAAFWIQNAQIILPQGDNAGVLRARLLASDGAHLLATGSRRVNITELAASRAGDAPLDAALTTLAAEVARQGGGRTALAVNVTAPDPAQPVVALCRFATGTPLLIPDCFALAGTDAIFAEVLIGTLTEIARQANLSVF